MLDQAVPFKHVVLIEYQHACVAGTAALEVHASVFFQKDIVNEDSPLLILRVSQT
jgi:3-hydroxy-3-methylglutaryl CoA synthase